MINYNTEIIKTNDYELAQWMKSERYAYCDQSFDDSDKKSKRRHYLVQMFISLFF